MKKAKIILLWGVLTGIVSVVYYQILNATGQDNSALKWFSLLILFLGIFIGTMQYRNKVNEGYLTFGQGFKTGLLICLLITLIGVVATAIDMQMHADRIDKMLEDARVNMINKGMPADQIEISMHYTKMFMTPGWIAAWVAIFDLFFGLICSLISAGINMKKKPIFDEVEEVPNNGTPQA